MFVDNTQTHIHKHTRDRKEEKQTGEDAFPFDLHDYEGFECAEGGVSKHCTSGQRNSVTTSNSASFLLSVVQ